MSTVHHPDGRASRMPAEERRELIVDAAIGEFARAGLRGANMDAVARAVGVTQPYIFRLFGTKKALFLACVERCFDRTQEEFERAAAGLTGAQALGAMGMAYIAKLRDRDLLLLQLHSYTACDDPDVRALVRRRYGELVALVERLTGVEGKPVGEFFAHGMLLNVLAAMDALDAPEPWTLATFPGLKI
jgi:AcrR family transcriptional regulator